MAARTRLVASFTEEPDLLAAIPRLQEAGVAVEEVFSPYPIHAVDALLGRGRSRLGWVTFGAGLVGAVSAFGFQLWAAAASWPLNVGGKPLNSSLAFVPITFELTVLFAGLATAAAFLFRSRLFPGLKPTLVSQGVTDDRLVLVIDAAGVGPDIGRAERILREAGAEKVFSAEVPR